VHQGTVTPTNIKNHKTDAIGLEQFPEFNVTQLSEWAYTSKYMGTQNASVSAISQETSSNKTEI